MQFPFRVFPLICGFSNPPPLTLRGEKYPQKPHYQNQLNTKRVWADVVPCRIRHVNQPCNHGHGRNANRWRAPDYTKAISVEFWGLGWLSRDRWQISKHSKNPVVVFVRQDSESGFSGVIVRAILSKNGKKGYSVISVPSNEREINFRTRKTNFVCSFCKGNRMIDDMKTIVGGILINPLPKPKSSCFLSRTNERARKGGLLSQLPITSLIKRFSIVGFQFYSDFNNKINSHRYKYS